MIAYLDGQIVGTRGRAIVINVGGVGYLVHVPSSVWTAATPGKKMTLHIYTHQTSDSIQLFGFARVDELQFFEELLSVNGVGPKSALDILERPVDEIRALILSGDAKALAKTKGIGPKTAARIVLELRNKMTGNTDVPDLGNTISDEVMHALLSLGYKKNDIETILERLPKEKTRAEDIVSWFLGQV